MGTITGFGDISDVELQRADGGDGTYPLAGYLSGDTTSSLSMKNW
jgi:hypothetical protein